MFWDNQDEARNQYDKIKVVAACERTLVNLRRSRELKREEYIENMMKKRRYYLFGRYLLREEAIARLQEADGITSWGMVDCMHAYQESLCERILYAASNTIGNGFWLSLHEANQLHWERP